MLDHEEKSGWIRKLYNRRVDYASFRKWQRDLDWEYQTNDLAGLFERERAKEESGGPAQVWSVQWFCRKNHSEKNFSEKWIIGADSVRLSNVRDYTQNDQHTHSVSFLKKKYAESAGLGPSGYSPIAQAFNKLPNGKKEKLKLKFDITNLVATENLPLLL